MSQWVNNYAIFQDLSVAQGRGVPVRIDSVVAAGERPPALHINEGAEEQFLSHYMGGGGEPRGAPDLGLIQQMLSMVKLQNPQPRHGATNINASMLNPNCAEFVPQYGAKLDFNDNRYHTDRRDRNVALRSLLEADSEKYKMQNVKLLKPDDIIESNMAFDRQQSPCYLASVPPAEMFKKKSPVQKITVVEPTVELNNNTCSLDFYQPSEYAKEYYNKCMERTKLRTYVKDDIWAKVENKMKEIEKRKQQSAQLCAEWELKENNENLNVVRLPCHRHVLAEECIVCDMVKKHRYNLKKFVPFPKGM